MNHMNARAQMDQSNREKEADQHEVVESRKEHAMRMLLEQSATAQEIVNGKSYVFRRVLVAQRNIM